MKKQDFEKKITLIVNQELPQWQVLNSVGHLSAYFGKFLGENFGTAEHFITLDGVKIPRNSQYPIVILAASSEQMDHLKESVQYGSREHVLYS